VRGVGEIGRLHAAAEPVDKIVLGLQDAPGLGVELRLLVFEPHGLAERRRGTQDIAGDGIEVVAPEARAQIVGIRERAGVGMDHGRAERLALAVHRQAAQHVAGHADGVHLLDVFGCQLAQHQHRADGAHPPVGGVLFTAAVRQTVRGIGRGHVAQDVQILIDERCLETARPNVKGQ